MAWTAYIPPAGISAASFHVPGVDAIDPADPPALLADYIDPDTGELASMTTAPHAVDAALADAFLIRKGTGASVMSFGHQFDKIKKKTERTERELKDEADQVLKPFVERGDVKVVSQTVDDQAFDQSGMLIEYYNRQTAKKEVAPR